MDHSTVFSEGDKRYNTAMGPKRSNPMPVKYWSFAGLLLTDWCNARCACCYLSCGPDRSRQMSVEEAMGHWRGLIEASPHGCRVHLTGGEPFGNYPRLRELCRRAAAEGLGPLDKIETNAFWATDEVQIRRRLRELDAAGMQKLCISADPYHQQFVPIDRPRRLARLVEDLLGPQRLQVRWRDWLAEGFNTAPLDAKERRDVFARYLIGGRERLAGRAAEILARFVQLKPWQSFADNPCQETLLRSRHVHIDPRGNVIPGVCVGIVLGRSGPQSLAEIWRQLAADFASRPIVGRLASGGPCSLWDEARQYGYTPREGYAGKCHLCWELRQHLASCGRSDDELGPPEQYGVDNSF